MKNDTEIHIKGIIINWGLYKQYLQEKYPAPEGEEWDFTCEYHKCIDDNVTKLRRALYETK